MDHQEACFIKLRLREKVFYTGLLMLILVTLVVIFASSVLAWFSLFRKRKEHVHIKYVPDERGNLELSQSEKEETLEHLQKKLQKKATIAQPMSLRSTFKKVKRKEKQTTSDLLFYRSKKRFQRKHNPFLTTGIYRCCSANTGEKSRN